MPKQINITFLTPQFQSILPNGRDVIMALTKVGFVFNFIEHNYICIIASNML